MSTEALLDLIGQHVAAIRTHLTHHQLRELSEAVRSLAEAEEEGAAARRALFRVRRALLPLPLDSPVRAAVDQHRYAAAGTAVAPERARALLSRLLPSDRSEPDGGAGGGADEGADGNDVAVREIIAAVERRLLAEPSRAAAELGPLAAADPVAAGLIRLMDPERGARYPDFQFDPDGGDPLPIVRRVNRVLMADQDPWGAADWWLGGNRWLAGIPADLLGRVPDALLAAAAQALVEED